MIDEDGGIIEGVMTFTLGILTTFILIFALGTVLDNFWYVFQSAGFGTSSVFAAGLNKLLSLTTVFYYAFGFWLFILGVWFFKTIIRRHPYTRVEEEEVQGGRLF